MKLRLIVTLVSTYQLLLPMELPPQKKIVAHVDLTRIKTAEEVLPKDFLEECGNACCATRTNTGCLNGVLCSTCVGAGCFVCGKSIASFFLNAGILGSGCMHCMDASNQWGLFAAVMGFVTVGGFSCYTGNYADQRKQMRDLQHERYVKDFEQLPLEKQEAEIKMIAMQRVKHLQNKID